MTILSYIAVLAYVIRGSAPKSAYLLLDLTTRLLPVVIGCLWIRLKFKLDTEGDRGKRPTNSNKLDTATGKSKQKAVLNQRMLTVPMLETAPN